MEKENTPVLDLTPKSPEQRIKNGLAEKGIAEKSIEDIKERYGSLKVTDINDTVGYQVVRRARIEVRDMRLGIEKYCDAAGKPAYEFYKACGTEKKRYLGMIEPLEAHLKEQEDFIEREKERIRAEEETRIRTRRQDRVKKLVALGMIFNGEDMYRIEFNGHTIAADEASITHLSEADFDTELQKISALKIRIDEAKEKERLALQAVAAEQKKERERLDAIAEANRKKEQELLDKERELNKAAEERAKAEREVVAAKAKALEIEKAKKQAVIDEQARQKAAEEAARLKELRKGDSPRLKALAKQISQIEMPAQLKSKEAQKIIEGVIDRLKNISAYIETESSKL